MTSRRTLDAALILAGLSLPPLKKRKTEAEPAGAKERAIAAAAAKRERKRRQLPPGSYTARVVEVVEGPSFTGIVYEVATPDGGPRIMTMPIRNRNGDET